MADARELIDRLRRYPERWDERVLQALGRVPRDAFVPASLRSLAWADRALPIGHGATISQPFVVAFMTQAAAVGTGDRVLEVGTGSGYQAAVLAELGCEIYSVEIVPALATAARLRLEALGYHRVHVREGDGSEGWRAAAPFDAVLVTAAAEDIPRPLVEQLRTGGRLVIPVGDAWQQLEVFEKGQGESLTSLARVPVRFVPLQHGAPPPGP